MPLIGYLIDYCYYSSADNTTGIESVYTVAEGHEIMFHVSTLLPHSKDHVQQVVMSTSY